MLPQRQGRSGPPRDGDVPEVAGGALGAAVDLAVGDDPGADAGGDLDEQQVVDRRATAIVCSPRAITLTSLSTSTGTRERARTGCRARRRRPSRA